MTDNERALLLALARFELQEHGSGLALRDAIAAVEAEAALIYPEWAAMADPVKSCGNCGDNARLLSDGDCDPDDGMQPCEGWQPKPTACPTCEGLGYWYDNSYGKCSDCNGTGKKEKT